MRAFFIIPFFIPVGVDYRTRRYPMATFTIMGICSAVHLLAIAVWLNGDIEAEEQFVQTMGFVKEAPNWYSWLTHMFTHGGIFHLLGNMVYLFLFGSCVEDLLGRTRFVIFYIVGGLCALGIYVLFAPPSDPEQMIPMVGASGAISACMGGFTLLLHRTRITIKWILLIFFRLFSGDWHLPAKLVMSFYFLSDLWGMIGSMDHTGGGVAFSAHVGGFLAGLGLMVVIKQTQGLLTDDELEEVEVKERAAKRGRRRVPATVYLYAGETQSGPFTRTQIAQMRELGTLEEGTLWWEEGMEDWRPLDEL